MRMYFVYKENYCQYTEERGVIVKSNSPERAKGIAMDHMNWFWGGRDKNKSMIKVEEIEQLDEGVICRTDSLINSTKWN